MTKPTQKKSAAPKKTTKKPAAPKLTAEQRLEALSQACQNAFNQTSEQYVSVVNSHRALVNVLAVISTILKEKGLLDAAVFEAAARNQIAAVLAARGEMIAEMRAAKAEGRDPVPHPGLKSDFDDLVAILGRVSSEEQDKAIAHADAEIAKDEPKDQAEA